MLSDDLLAKLNTQVDMSLQTKTETKEVKEKEIINQPKEQKGGSKVQISLIVPNENKNRWKAFFSERGITLTNGISMALDYFMKQVEEGKVEIDFYGMKTK